MKLQGEKRKKPRRIANQDKVMIEIPLPFPKGTKVVGEVIDVNEFGLAFMVSMDDGYFSPGTILKEAILLEGGKPYQLTAEVLYKEKISESDKLIYRIGVKFKSNLMGFFDNRKSQSTKIVFPEKRGTERRQAHTFSQRERRRLILKKTSYNIDLEQQLLLKSMKSASKISVNRRRYARKSFRTPVRFEVNGITHAGYLAEISPSGMLIVSRERLSAKARLLLMFSFDEDKSSMNISGTATTIRDIGNEKASLFNIGIQFDDLSEGGQKILAAYIQLLTDRLPKAGGKQLSTKHSSTPSNPFSSKNTMAILITDKKERPSKFTPRRVVITGIGVVAPNGIGRKAFWKNLAAGENCVDRISFFDPSKHPSQVAAEIRDFDPEVIIPRKEVKRMGRSAHLGIAAAKLAVEDALLKITVELKSRIGVIVGTGTSGTEYAERDFYAMQQGGIRHMRAYAAIAGFGGALSSEISRALGITGSSITVSTGCTGSTDAIGYAFKNISHGMADLLLTGGSDACVTSGILGAFCQIGATCTNFNNNPKKASRPFNQDRDGFVIGEGAWIFVLEELNHALRRGARIYGEIAGYGSTCDAYHMSRPLPSGRYSAEAMNLALLDAMVRPEEVDYINAYGNATRINDSYETSVIKQVFGQHAKKLMVSSIKSMIGHSIGSCGAGGVAATLMAISEGIVPPTINYEVPDPECDLDYVPNVARSADVKVALCNTLAFGAKNSVLILRHFEP